MFTHESLLELRSNPRRTRKVSRWPRRTRSIDQSIDRSMDGRRPALVVLSFGAICPSGGGETS